MESCIQCFGCENKSLGNNYFKGGGGGGGCNALYYKLIYSFPHPFLVRNFWVADRLDLCTLSYLVA